MDTFFHFEDISVFDAPQTETEKALKEIEATEKKNIEEVNIIFCSDDYLLEMNKKYLNHDYYTDIITFDNSEGENISGDLFISIDRIRENAGAYGVSFENELQRVIIHGVLHLVGYKDHSPKEKETMRNKENFYLSFISPSN